MVGGLIKRERGRIVTDPAGKGSRGGRRGRKCRYDIKRRVKKTGALQVLSSPNRSRKREAKHVPQEGATISEEATG